MPSHKAKCNGEIIPYRDLTDEEFPHLEVLKRTSPKEEPSILNNTSWKCKCVHCGKERSVSGRVLHNQGYKDCTCEYFQNQKEDAQVLDVGEVVGRGAIYMMENEPDKFLDYLKRKDIESRRYYSPHAFKSS